MATNEIAQTGLSSLPPVIYYSEQLFSSDASLRDHLFSRVEQSGVAALSTRKLRQSPQWSQVYSLRLLDKKHTVDEPDEEACKKQIDKKLQHFWSHDWPLLKETMDKAIETLP